MAADKMVGGARALLGQGLGMGWGDEGEAWLRAKLGGGKYEDLVKQIRGEYGQYSKENPVTSAALEFGGGAAPGVAAMMVPGGQVAGAQQVGRSTMGALARMGLMGAGTGAVSGAGSADEGNRTAGGATGAVVGGALGVAAPVALRGASGATNWLRERLAPTDALVQKRATQKMAGAMGETGMTPAEITAARTRDTQLGVPSVVANTNPSLVDLAEAVAQRTGAGARKVETRLGEQKLGARERTQQQVVKGLKPGDYYDDLAKLEQEMKDRAGPLYEQAYAHGEVTDPEVLKFLSLPQFQQGMGEAQKLLAAEGRKMDLTKPTVETLDQTKRGIDALIEKETDPITGKMTSLGRVYAQKKNEFLTALDKAVPDYELARGVYAGGAELRDAMRTGINEFGKMDHEQVIKKVAGMSDAEKEAFRTGVARDLYDKIMKPSGNFNAAQRIIGSPEMKAKLQPLFDSPEKYKLFESALTRESQLFNEANRVLGGSQTGKRLQMRENLESGEGVGDAMIHAVTGGWKSGLTNLVTGAMKSSTMTDKTAGKLADMLMAKDPHEVAAVVKLLEEHIANAGPKALKASATEAGTGTGLATAINPAPEAPGKAPDIDAEEPNPFQGGPDIEADIAAESKR